MDFGEKKTLAAYLQINNFQLVLFWPPIDLAGQFPYCVRFYARVKLKIEFYLSVDVWKRKNSLIVTPWAVSLISELFMDVTD